MPSRNGETRPRAARSVFSLVASYPFVVSIFRGCNQAVICYNNLIMTHPTPIDITNMPELVKIAEEVEATNTPRELRRENKPVALITPVTGAKKATKQKAKTKADYEA